MGGGILNRYFTTRGAPECKDLVIQTQLLSPRQPVLSKLTKGAILKVQLIAPLGPCVAIYEDEIVGTVIHKDLLQLINCLGRGVDFTALVRNITGGSCLVTIKPTRS